MNLKEQIAADLVTAMKEREELKLSVLRMLKAEFQRAQADKGRSSELSEEDLQALVRRLIKQRREAAEQYRGAGAVDRAEAELAEASVLEVYLPAQLGDAELDMLVAAAAKEAGAVSVRDMGRLMRVLMPQVAGRADGNRVKERVEAFLG